MYIYIYSNIKFNNNNINNNNNNNTLLYLQYIIHVFQVMESINPGFDLSSLFPSPVPSPLPYGASLDFWTDWPANPDINMSGKCQYTLHVFIISTKIQMGARGGVVVKALRSKPAGRGFSSRCCHWNFSLI